MNRKQDLLEYFYEQEFLSCQILMQAHPLTATGVGLDKIADIIRIMPRFNNETDMSLRDRIFEALE